MPRPSLLRPPPERRLFLNAVRSIFQRPPLAVSQESPPPKPARVEQLWLGSLTKPRS